MSAPSTTSFISLRRILIITGSTITQLIRMKVFWFLAPIALLFMGLQFFDAFWYEGPEASQPQQELQMHKNLCLGAMMLFGSLFAIVSTALLIPRDIEDRTLYTILCKPVPRLDYLCGKLLGVISVIFIAMLVMDLLLVVTLHFRTLEVIGEMDSFLKSLGWEEDLIAQKKEDIAAHGPSLMLQYGVFAHFLKASIVAAVALLISTFSTSTIFTIATSVLVWIIGALQGIARDVFINDQSITESTSLAAKVLGTLISLIFPDFQIFESVADSAARATAIGSADMLQLSGLAFFYIGVYTVLSWFIFSDKEF